MTNGINIFSCSPWLEHLAPRALILLSLWRYISHVLTHLFTYILTYLLTISRVYVKCLIRTTLTQLNIFKNIFVHTEAILSASNAEKSLGGRGSVRELLGSLQCSSDSLLGGKGLAPRTRHCSRSLTSIFGTFGLSANRCSRDIT